MTSWFGGVDIFVLVSMRGWSATTCGCEEDWLGMGGHLAAAGGLSVMYLKDKISYFKNVLEGWAKEAHLLPTPTSIVDVTMVLVSLIDFFNGFEFPDDGNVFTSGYYALSSVHSTLESAAPDSRDWSGPAAEIYGDDNTALAALVKQMQNLDQRMQEQTASQAAAVQKAHTAVGLGVAGLIAAHAIALALYLNPGCGPAMSFAWQLAAAAGTCSGVVAFEAKAAEHAQTVADEVKSIGKEYDELAEQALQVAAAGGVGVGATPALTSVGWVPALPATPTITTMVDLSAGNAGTQVRPGGRLSAGDVEALHPRESILAVSSAKPAAQPRPAVRPMHLISQTLRQRSGESTPAVGQETAEAGVELTAGAVPTVAASPELGQDSRQLARSGGR
ncbi:MAG: hypothetical protein K2Q25_13115 [Mycobacteriaceae bacterium]|nr:hypothetical protein [Mycobacteriaceae bacterium]